MKIHYQNSREEERFIDGVVHLQNVDNEHLTALLENGKELTLNIRGVEGIVDSSVVNDGWVSVNDRLPEKEALAVCMDPRSPSYEEKQFGWICYSEKEQRFFCVYENLYLFDVTHWRDDPLPMIQEGRADDA